MRGNNLQAIRVRVARIADGCRRDSGPASMTLEKLVAGSFRKSGQPSQADDSSWLALMGGR